MSHTIHTDSPCMRITTSNYARCIMIVKLCLDGAHKLASHAGTRSLAGIISATLAKNSYHRQKLSGTNIFRTFLCISSRSNSSVLRSRLTHPASMPTLRLELYEGLKVIGPSFLESFLKGDFFLSIFQSAISMCLARFGPLQPLWSERSSPAGLS